MIKDNEIYKILLENPEDPATALIKKANENGGYDNITTIIVDNV